MTEWITMSNGHDMYAHGDLQNSRIIERFHPWWGGGYGVRGARYDPATGLGELIGHYPDLESAKVAYLMAKAIGR